MLYLHAHDFDHHLPDLPGASYLTNLRRRLHLGSTTEKVRALFSAHQVRSVGEVREAHQPHLESALQLAGEPA